MKPVYAKAFGLAMFAFAIALVNYSSLYQMSIIALSNYSPVPVEETPVLVQAQSSQQSREMLIKQCMADSEAIFLKARKYRLDALKKLVQDYEGQPNWYLNKKYGRVFWDYFFASFDCPYTSERVGALGVGGKWVCGLQQLIASKYPCIVYSFGAGNGASFETELLQRTNCSIRVHDASVTEDTSHLRILMSKYPDRVKSSETQLPVSGNDPHNLAQLMAQNSDTFIDILKLDGRGQELHHLEELLRSFKGRHQVPVGQLQVRFNLVPIAENREFLHVFNKLWTRLEDAGFRPFHREVMFLANVYTNSNEFKNFEYSFLNVKTDHVLLHATRE